jgi:hypothetical protein
MTTAALIAKVEAGEIRRSKLREETQKALDNAERTLYESRRAESDLHPVGCHCWLCDYVANYEYEQSLLFPASEPNYCRE